ncbi:MAG TPA: glycosyltransferase [Xanthomonadaceae bacterium]|nr:glycosyltransferase [Xanthomonadaceae bacterium]
MTARSGTIAKATPAGDPPRPVDLLRDSPLFDQAWYARTFPDVGLLGIDPVEHYLRYGARIGRSPGPLFDGPRYLKDYPDVRRVGANPLLHYLEHGRREGRIARRLERVPVGDPEARLRAFADAVLRDPPQRMFERFDVDTEEEFLACLEGVRAGGAAPFVSIVMPVRNRSRLIGRAIRSVVEQLHAQWELLVVDDGSTDGTIAVVEEFADPRIRLFRQDQRGVSAARNVGLAEARGEWIFYLDSDNRWAPNFLSSMLAYLAASGRECAYSAIAVEDERGKVSGYRGEPFDWDACFKGNYVDLNAFCHRRSLHESLGGFDESLRRMVDWDLILRYTRQARPAYAPFVGCYYLDSQADAARISVSQPIAYRAVVQAKHRLASPTPEAVARGLSLRFAIKIPAPYEKRMEWGDFHYAESLKQSLERLGHSVQIDFLGDWYGRPVNHDHVVIALRGLSAYEPSPGQINLMWNISHPDQVAYAEYEAYDRVYLASLSYPALLGRIVATPAQSLLQCTDVRRFAIGDGAPVREGVLFVGNSRGEYRRIVRWAVEAGLEPRIYGTRWEAYVPSRLVAGENIPNTGLAAHYGTADVVLNDHWDSMRDFGFVSNRIFDVVASGGHVVSDAVPAIGRLFAHGVTEVRSAAGLAGAVAGLGAIPPAERERERREAAEEVARLHTFDARAKAICNDVLLHLGLPAVHDGAGTGVPAAEPPPLRVGLLMQPGRRGPTSSGYIRLIAPLTVDAAHAQVRVRVLAGVDDPALDECDACIVQRVAVPDQPAADRLRARLAKRAMPLLVDTDDAIALLGDEHPETEAYRGKDAVLRRLMADAAEVWFSTAPLRACYPDVERAAVVPNTLDPRLWRDYRKRRAPIGGADALRLLYMGTATHDSDFAVVLPALDRLHAEHPGRFRLTVVGALKQPPDRPWLETLAPPPGQHDYPRFVRWLSRQGPFDVGLAPLAATPFNACKSDIKFLDYSALGLLSVVSKVPAYAALEHAGLALCVPEGDTAWFDALDAVLSDPAAHEPMAARAADYVWRERTPLDGALARRIAAVAGRRIAEGGRT